MRGKSVAVVASVVGVLGAGGLGVGVSGAVGKGRSAATTIGLRSTALGRVLVDGQGHTLYVWEGDKGKASKCYAACASAWPPVTVSGKPKAGKGLTASKLGTIRRSDGKTQATYAGHPLYRFVGDGGKVGSTKGQKLHAFGFDWYVVGPSGKSIGG
jgi:predicted lipoprotein with Yx(FWY)xxD motif